MDHHAASAGRPFGAGLVPIERNDLMPAFPPVLATEQDARISSRIDDAGLIGMTRLNMPHSRHFGSGQALDLETFFTQLPALSTVGAGVDMRTEPGAVHRRIQALGISRIGRNVIDLRATEEG